MCLAWIAEEVPRKKSMAQRRKIIRRSPSLSSDSDELEIGTLLPDAIGTDQTYHAPGTELWLGSASTCSDFLDIGIIPESVTQLLATTPRATAVSSVPATTHTSAPDDTCFYLAHSSREVAPEFQMPPSTSGVSTRNRQSYRQNSPPVAASVRDVIGSSTSSTGNLWQSDVNLGMQQSPADQLPPQQGEQISFPLVLEEPPRISELLINSDIHEREGSDYDNVTGNHFSASSSDSESLNESDTDIPADTGLLGAEGASIDPGYIPPKTNTLLYPGSPITTEESFLSILSFAQSEKLSGVGFVKLLKLIDLHCPKPNNCSKSYEQILNHFEHVKTPLQSYFFCNKCLSELVSLTDTCLPCKELKPSVDQIIVLSVNDQLSQLYARPQFLQDIEYKFKRQKCGPDNYEDLYDGSVYRKKVEEGVLEDRHNLSIMWNVDGASPFNSSNIQVWPCFGVINELPPEKRFRHENLLLFAVFIGEGKPNPNTYLKYVYPEVESLKQGFSVLPAGYSEPITVKTIWLCGTCDSPAKSMMFNQKNFNGFFSCPKCLNEGEKSDRTGGVFVHPSEDNIVLRTDSGYEEDAMLAVTSNVGVSKKKRISPHGIKGTTYLYLMVDSMIKSTSIDSMHCLYLGVTKQFLELWFSKTYKDENFSLYKVEKVVSHRLTTIQPPNFVKRMPRSLHKLSKWKAYEFMLMLYYYLVPSLDGIMQQIFFHNFKLFVSGVSILNQNSVSLQDVDLAKALLQQFVRDFQELYDFRHMSFNVHLVLHLPEVVECLGPLWCTSCFRFEDFNGKMLSLIHGSRYVGSQVPSHLFTFLSLPRLVSLMAPGDSKNYCTSVAKKGKRVKITECIKDKYFTVGRYSKLVNLPQWMLNALREFQFTSLFSFERVKVNGMLVTSENYRRSKRTCSEYVRYSHEDELQYGSVKAFVKLTMCQCENVCLCDGKYFAFVLQHNAQDSFTTSNPPSSLKYIKKCEETQSLILVPVTTIVNVCFNIKMNNVTFLCDPLNSMEMYN